jgi:hypothetical protein
MISGGVALVPAAGVDRRQGGLGLTREGTRTREGEKGVRRQWQRLLMVWRGRVGEKEGLGGGRQPHGGEGLGTVWGTGTAVGRRRAVGTGPKPTRASGGVRAGAQDRGGGDVNRWARGHSNGRRGQNDLNRFKLQRF